MSHRDFLKAHTQHLMLDYVNLEGQIDLLMVLYLSEGLKDSVVFSCAVILSNKELSNKRRTQTQQDSDSW